MIHIIQIKEYNKSTCTVNVKPNAERSGRASPAARGVVEDVLAGWT